MSRRKMFEAYVGGFFGPKDHYYIFKEGDNYIFEYSGISEDFDNIDEYIEKEDEAYYERFINEINEMIKDWAKEYVNKNVLDGTQWNIIINGKKYYGSNEFPKNFRKVFQKIDDYFSKAKYKNVTVFRRNNEN